IWRIFTSSVRAAFTLGTVRPPSSLPLRMSQLAAVLMAGGLGTRMKSAVPKHFHDLLGRPMVEWIIEAGREAGADPVVVVASPSTRDRFEGSGVEIAVQETPLGTGDAVRSANAALASHEGDVLILSGDTPLLTAELLRDLV